VERVRRNPPAQTDKERGIKKAKFPLATEWGGSYSYRSFEFGELNIMRRARGAKTRKAVSKRFKITGSGKVMRNHSGKRHLLSCKSPKRRRKLGTSVELDKSDYKRVIENLPFSR
jgi:large subunit ribosomal protein L35